MKILYAIQGTGNGHISRARDVVPCLQQYGELDILVSGTQADVHLGFPIDYQFHGLSFVFGKRGGIDFWKTIFQIRPFRLLKELWKLNVDQYDIIINDFEPVSAWACMLKSKSCLGLSHQAAVIHPYSPKPKKNDVLGYLILKYYAPVSRNYGFHFKTYSNGIYTPIIRKEVRDLKDVKSENYYTVYLPAYNDCRLIELLSQLNANFQVFSKHCSKRRRIKNLEIIPIDNKCYLESLRVCKGVICGAGFEGPAEALFLKKKLLVIPMKGQYEQQCNASALGNMGVRVLQSFHFKYIEQLKEFIYNEEIYTIDFPDETVSIIDKLIQDNIKANSDYTTTSFSLS